MTEQLREVLRAIAKVFPGTVLCCDDGTFKTLVLKETLSITGVTESAEAFRGHATTTPSP